MTDDQAKDSIRQLVERLLSDPTAEFQLRCGVQEVAPQGEWKSYQPTDAFTFVIKTHGGAAKLDRQGHRVYDETMIGNPPLESQ